MNRRAALEWIILSPILAWLLFGALFFSLIVHGVNIVESLLGGVDGD